MGNFIWITPCMHVADVEARVRTLKSSTMLEMEL